jgi:hypothetical protein
MKARKKGLVGGSIPPGDHESETDSNSDDSDVSEADISFRPANAPETMKKPEANPLPKPQENDNVEQEVPHKVKTVRNLRIIEDGDL